MTRTILEHPPTARRRQEVSGLASPLPSTPRAAERRTWRSWFEDGIPDLVGGAMFVASGAVALTGYLRRYRVDPDAAAFVDPLE